jgi:hypothetical protein
MVNLMRNKKRRYLSNFGFARTATLTPVAARSLALLGLTASVIRVRHEGEFDDNRPIEFVEGEDFRSRVVPEDPYFPTLGFRVRDLVHERQQLLHSGGFP